DILQELGQKKDKQFLVGFAAETEQVDKYALEKLKRKNADMIVANDVSAQGAGFGGDTNIVTIYHKDNTLKKLPLLSKSEVEKVILLEIIRKLGEGNKQ